MKPLRQPVLVPEDRALEDDGSHDWYLVDRRISRALKPVIDHNAELALELRARITRVASEVTLLRGDLRLFTEKVPLLRAIAENGRKRR